MALLVFYPMFYPSLTYYSHAPFLFILYISLDRNSKIKKSYEQPFLTIILRSL